MYDAIIIGGGFYGCELALHLKKYFNNILLIEKKNDLLTEASLNNQARIHNGYHYPRSFMTAYRSHMNFSRFANDFKDCVEKSFEKHYAIASLHSKVNAKQFNDFCIRIGAPIKKSPPKINKLFNKNLIEDVFQVQEYAFNAIELRRIIKKKLLENNINVMYNTEMKNILSLPNNNIEIELKDGQIKLGKYVFSCTYAGTNTLLRMMNLPLVDLNHEIHEFTLVKLPIEYRKYGFTVMDGPFFSTMPFPTRKNLHTLSHVNYSAHEGWYDNVGYMDPHEYINRKRKFFKTNYLSMLKDVNRYIPKFSNLEYIESIFTIKTFLDINDMDDGRPILFKKDYGIKNFFVVLGGKIDNIYDLLKYIDITVKALKNKQQRNKQLNRYEKLKKN